MRNKATVSQLAFSCIRQNPGLTAWQIAKYIGKPSDQVSSKLKRAVDNGILMRRKDFLKGPWLYYSRQVG